jgi:hypothetical protein
MLYGKVYEEVGYDLADSIIYKQFSEIRGTFVECDQVGRVGYN